MLEQKTFLQGLNYLKCSYLNWQFDLNNDLMLKVWFKKFSDLDNEVYIQLVEKYTDVSKFPPNSPADILNLLPQDLNVVEAWDKILGVIKRAFNNSSFLNTMAKELPSLYPFVQNWDIEKVETDCYGNKCYNYQFGRKFRREYNEHLANKKLIKLTNGSIKLLTNESM